MGTVFWEREWEREIDRETDRLTNWQTDRDRDIDGEREIQRYQTIKQSNWHLCREQPTRTNRRVINLLQYDKEKGAWPNTHWPWGDWLTKEVAKKVTMRSILETIHIYYSGTLNEWTREECYVSARKLVIFLCINAWVWAFDLCSARMNIIFCAYLWCFLSFQPDWAIIVCSFY